MKLKKCLSNLCVEDGGAIGSKEKEEEIKIETVKEGNILFEMLELSNCQIYDVSLFVFINFDFMSFLNINEIKSLFYR